MKLISFAIPSYNSESYLHHAVDTILTGGEDVEIIIVNDGSKDGTAAIADAYAEKYPTIVKAIHKPNGGHGSGVNRGLQEATGLYYKVVDSDDWVDEKALQELILTVKRHVKRGIEADLYIHNFVYEHVEDNTQKCRSWRKKFPVGKFFGWEDVKPFVASETLLMHNLLYKTEPLRASGTVLPEHTFYVDNLFAYQPLPYMKKLFYIDVDLYRYFIGRADQSVNMNNFVNRYDQQIRVMNRMLEAYTFDQITEMPKGLRKYLLQDLSAIMMNTMMFCCSGGDDEIRRAAYKQMWDDLKERDPQLFDYLYHKSLPAIVTWMPWKIRGSFMLAGYKALCKFLKLG